ncbi:MAG: hypothetical protein IPP48_12660 [Chitinophagaceae bacterium]|nr:hypothetical protein [Chitinophagaceae bacterium]
MKKAFFFLAMLSIGSIAHAQTDSSFTKGENNLEYKIYSSNQGELIKYGSFVKMHFTQMYRGAKDTVLYDSKDYTSPIQPIDTANLPGYYYAILKQLRPNDSVDIRIIIDSAYKNSQVPMPPMFEKGNYLYTCIKIEDVFSTKEKADSAINSEQQIAAMLQAQKNIAIFAKETDVINQYMASNKITGAIKTPKGSFIKKLKRGW